MALRNRPDCPSANSGDIRLYVQNRKKVRFGSRSTRATPARRSNGIRLPYHIANRTCAPRISRHRVRHIPQIGSQILVHPSNPVLVGLSANNYISTCDAILPHWIHPDDEGYFANG